MKSSLLALFLAAAAEAHVGVFTDGMFCRGGNDPSTDDQNTNLVVNPLYDLPTSAWWMQADRGCDKVPPPDGEFLTLPAGGDFTVELAINRAFTTLSHGGVHVSDWPDGEDHPEDWASPDGDTCLMDNPDGAGGPLHTQNETTAAGTAWAISYAPDLASVSMDNLVVFSVLQHTPWKRLATYDVPADLPACPAGGCYCAWLWVPDGCGQPNMYMQNFRCNVTNTSSTEKKLGVARPPVPCRDDPSRCVAGPKQMIAWNQAEGNNVGDVGFSPGYGASMGYQPGAQNDIFVEDGAQLEPVPVSASNTASPTSGQPHPSTTVGAEQSAVASESPTVATGVTASVPVAPIKTGVAAGEPGGGSCRARRRRRRQGRPLNAAQRG